MSILVGVGRGAQEGVPVKNAEAIERLEEATTIVVDKTGTLTDGKPKPVDGPPTSGFGTKEFLNLAGSLEQNSEHPLAAAIVQGAKKQGLVLPAVTDLRSVTAGGVDGAIARCAVMIGKPTMRSAGVTLVEGDLRGIAKAIRLSRATVRHIRQNPFFSFLYSALGIPMASGVLYPFFDLLLSPISAGAAMSLSSVSVIANALRLRNAALRF